jgi:hypothetical protein
MGGGGGWPRGKRPLGGVSGWGAADHGGKGGATMGGSDTYTDTDWLIQWLSSFPSAVAMIIPSIIVKAAIASVHQRHFVEPRVRSDCLISN